jgi:hypothetical protein
MDRCAAMASAFQSIIGRLLQVRDFPDNSQQPARYDDISRTVLRLDGRVAGNDKPELARWNTRGFGDS